LKVFDDVGQLWLQRTLVLIFVAVTYVTGSAGQATS